MPTYPVSIPDHRFKSQKWRQVNLTAIEESPFTFSQQVFQHPGQRWECDIMLPRMRRERAEEWVAFLMSLNGMRGTFLLGDAVGSQARGAAGGVPKVREANLTGDVLKIDGCTPSVTGWLLRGDWVQLGGGSAARLYKVIGDADSNAGGQVDLEIWPKLRSSPADDETVLISNTRGVFRMPSNSVSWSVDDIALFGLGFAAVEAL